MSNGISDGCLSDLSANRHFPCRFHTRSRDAFLTSPALVVAFALAGDAAIDIVRDRIATTTDGRAVRLADLWPRGGEIDAVAAKAMRAGDYAECYASAEASAAWRDLAAPAAPVFPWDPASTYLRPPPFVRADGGARSEEHTSELQSLMRTSYAVFCLKNKKK